MALVLFSELILPSFISHVFCVFYEGHLFSDSISLEKAAFLVQATTVFKNSSILLAFFFLLKQVSNFFFLLDIYAHYVYCDCDDIAVQAFPR